MGEKRFLALDGMRGVAALAVFATHMGERPAALVSGGYLAVDFFFCLSGFVLAHAYGESELSVFSFLRLRAIRLYPLYMAGLTLGIVAATTLGANPLQTLGATAFSLFLLPTPAFVVRGLPAAMVSSIYPLDAPAWSLFFEIVANAAWFPLRRFLSRGVAVLTLAGCATVFALSISIYGLDAGYDWPSFAAGFGRVAFGFMAGVLTYRAWRSARWRPRLPWWVATAILVIVLCLPVDRRAFDPIAALLLTPPVVFLGACSVESGRWNSAAQRLLGDSSYAVYTLHFPVFLMVDQLTPLLRTIGLAHPSMLTMAATVVIVTTGAVWLDRVYDRPLRRRLVGWTVKKPQASVAGRPLAS